MISRPAQREAKAVPDPRVRRASSHPPFLRRSLAALRAVSLAAAVTAASLGAGLDAAAQQADPQPLRLGVTYEGSVHVPHATGGFDVPLPEGAYRVAYMRLSPRTSDGGVPTVEVVLVKGAADDLEAAVYISSSLGVHDIDWVFGYSCDERPVGVTIDRSDSPEGRWRHDCVYIDDIQRNTDLNFQPIFLRSLISDVVAMNFTPPANLVYASLGFATDRALIVGYAFNPYHDHPSVGLEAVELYRPNRKAFFAQLKVFAEKVRPQIRAQL